MVTKFFRSPFDTPSTSDGNWNFSIAQEGMGGFFFSKMILHVAPPLLAIKKFQSPSNIPHHRMSIERDGAYAIILE